MIGAGPPTDRKELLTDPTEATPTPPVAEPAVDPAFGTTPEPGSPATPHAREEPGGLRHQLGATKDALLRLVRAHRELARAELDQILDEVKRVAILGGVALAALLLVGILLPVGLALFLGEWLFGSLGWGVLHGTLFLVAVAVSAGLLALGMTGGQLARGVLIAVVVGIAVGILFALAAPNAAWTRLGESLGLAIDPGIRPLLVGIVAVAIAGAILGLVAGGVAGGAAVPGLIGGLVLGAILGAFSAISFDVRAGAAVGVAVGLLVWPILVGASVLERGIDFDALKARFWPSVSVDTARETLEWARKQAPIGPKP